MNDSTAEVVISGARIAEISVAYHLAVRRGMTGVVIVDERPPMSLTSDTSTECYRNWWPGCGIGLLGRAPVALRPPGRLPSGRPCSRTESGARAGGAQ